MKETRIAWVVLLCFVSNLSLAERVQWDHVRQPTEEPLVIAAKANLELNAVRKDVEEARKILSYRLQWRTSGTTQTIWQAECDGGMDWIAEVSFAISGASNRVGLIAISRFAENFYEILLAPDARAEQTTEALADVRRLTASPQGVALGWRRQLGQEYLDAKTEGADLKEENGRWILRLTVSRPRTDETGKRVRIPGQERCISNVLLSKPVGVQGSNWSVVEKEDESDSARVCRSNLGKISAAKEQWALAEGKLEGDDVVTNKVDEYIRHGHPVCPDGGEYTYGPVGAAPACAVHGVQH